MRKVIDGTDIGEHIDGTRFSDTIHGNGGDDGIGGHRGDDFIFGDAGNDRLHGGEDHDQLTGGSGSDTFIFRSLAAADSDHILDFNGKVDHFELDHLIFRVLDRGQLHSDEFRLGTRAKDGDDHIIYDEAKGKLYFDDDGNGAHKKHLLGTLDNHATVTADDIFVA